MKSEMKTKALRFLSDIQTGPFGSQLHKEDYVDDGTPIVTVEHLGNRVFTEQNLPRVSNEDKQRLSKYILKEGDIVFSRVGSVDRCSFVDSQHTGWLFSGRCLRVRPFEEISPLFLYYFFCLESTKKFIRNIAVGATMPSINTKLMGEIEVSYPDKQVQEKIANLLGAIDNKIELNNAINDNLEAVLAASHSKMFFSKDTSEHSKLGELMTFGNGKSRPKTDGPIPVYGGNGVLSYTDHHNIENAVLIGRVGAYCGSVYLEQGICWVSDNAIFAKSKITKDEFFDYFLLKRLNLFNHHVGTGQQLLTQEILNNIEVPKPVTEQIELFNRKATSIFETIFTNSREIIRLQELSDLLLSRLAG